MSFKQNSYLGIKIEVSSTFKVRTLFHWCHAWGSGYPYSFIFMISPVPVVPRISVLYVVPIDKINLKNSKDMEKYLINEKLIFELHTYSSEPANICSTSPALE